MMRLNHEHEVFQASLRNFELVLASYGYIYLQSEHSYQKGLPIESMTYKYRSKDKRLDARISFVISENNTERIQVDFEMLGPERKSFYLTFYQDAHPSAPKIQTNLFVGKNFGTDVQIFFAGLENAFATYLNEQISGVTFEDHSSKITDAYYSYDVVYDMQKEVVDAAREKREIKLTKASLWDRLRKFFKE